MQYLELVLADISLAFCYHRPMRTIIFACITFAVGMVISVMVVLNTQFAVATSTGVSMLVNQMVGIVILTLILSAVPKTHMLRQESLAGRPPRWLWFGGVFGLAILILNITTVTHSGASLAMASTVFGQSLMSLVFDATGLWGMQKRRLTLKDIPPLGISTAGIITMTAGAGSFSLPWVLLGMLAGALTMTQMVYNSLFSAYRGALFSARNNVVSGLLAGLLWFFLTDATTTSRAFPLFFSTPVWLSLGGGALGVIVVLSANIIIPRLPGIYSALLLSAGQIIMSVIIDMVLFDMFSVSLLIGALLLIAGMGLNLWKDNQSASA